MNNVIFKGEVEIDECYLYLQKRRYENRGRPYSLMIWIFGLKERHSKRVILYPVKNRTHEVLIEIINKHVAKGSTIISDGWSAYFNTQ